jgi:hypothetical protein
MRPLNGQATESKRTARNDEYSEVEALARILLTEIQRFFESEEGKREFAQWKAQREAETDKD